MTGISSSAMQSPASSGTFTGATADGQPRAMLSLRGIGKTYGSTVANSDLSFDVAAGEIVALIGANGAGKSTLMRILSGVTTPDTGSLDVEGGRIDLKKFSPVVARCLGIRIAHQEFSLCPSLTVLENFYLEDPSVAGADPLWRRRYRTVVHDSIEAIFPNTRITPEMRIESLSIAERQMVEIARAASDPALKLLILDEPTSSLEAERSQDLRRWMKMCAAKGVSIIFISHKLAEVAEVSERLIVMRGGRLVWTSAMSEVAVPRMVELMAGDAVTALDQAARRIPKPGAPLCVIEPASKLTAERLELRAGEVVGIAGLEGNGQRELISAVYLASRGRRRTGIDCPARAAFVSGDRGKMGIFPLWDVLANVTVGTLERRRSLATTHASRESDEARPWFDKVKLDWARAASPIIQLSGGNQQKALMARALMSDADVLIFDDPTRGVDVGVKTEFYRLVAAAAEAGKLVLWYSSETLEFLECDRVLVMSDDRVMQELSGEAIGEDQILAASFESKAKTTRGEAGQPARARIDWLAFTAPVTTLVIYGLIAMMNAQVLGLFGLDLMVSAAAPLILVALAQMFIIGGSEIDLGAGAFAALINVLSATLLVDTPALGCVAIFGALTLYVGFGMIIHARQIPSLIVTLGASFIWIGIGYAIQPSPAGSSPEWLTDAYGLSPLGLPSSIWVVVIGALAALTLNRSRFGVVLRGFGSNPLALERAGWSPLGAIAARFAIAGCFAAAAGLLMTAINTASDINAGSPYTLLSVAAVVIGGCSLMGGRIFPIGVACGAMTLSLIGSLLGLLGVSTDYNAAVQGALLISVLVLRSLSTVGRP